MYLKKSFNKESGRTYLSIAQKYRHPVKKVSTDRNIESLGYLDELEKKYDDPIAHFKEVARKMTEEDDTRKKVVLNINMDEELPKDSSSRKNLGYAAILKIYHELGLNEFFNNRARNAPFKYNTNSIMMLLVISRLLSPGSKYKAFEEKSRYFERFAFSLADIYRALSHFAGLEVELQEYLNEMISARYKRNTATIYYDVTNFYFEIDKADDLENSAKTRRADIIQ